MELPTNPKKLSSFFKFRPFKMTEQLESFQLEDELWPSTLPLVQPNFIFGVELEMENIKVEPKPNKFNNYWTPTTDNSLRNNGVEFVSLPLKAFQIEKALTQLQTNNLNYKPEFTERTSTHVHMNVRDLTLDQIMALVLVYTSVEKLLFKWVGHDRQDNIFCCPLWKTNYFKYFATITQNPLQIPRTWQKYTALNLIPIYNKGTVEFRHLYGTWDKEVIIPWINLLSRMKIYVKKHSLNSIYEKICNLNTDSFYTEYVNEIFGNQAYSLLKDVENLQDFLEDSITYCKLVICLIQDQTLEQHNPAIMPIRNATVHDINIHRIFRYQMLNGQSYNIQEQYNPQRYATKTDFMRAIHEHHPWLDTNMIAIYQSIGDDFFGV